MNRYGARSLFSVLYVSIAGVALSIYLLMQFLIEDAPDPVVPIGERFSLDYFVDTLRDSGGPLAVFFLLLMVTIWIVLRHNLAPMRRLSDHASRITPTNLDERLSASDAPTEIAPLVEAFNASLDRLEEAWKSQRAFSANAAHELRTPLAALRAHVESLLPPQAHAEATAEFDRLSRIISQLLLMSEGDHGVIRRAAGFDLAAVVTERTAEYAPAFLRSGRRIGLDTAGAPLPRMGDPVLVGIAVRNLLDNALKHTPAGASISVEIDGEGVVTVADDGPGLAADFADRAFEPFARADPNSAGAGLGLSIVARVARLHGGEAWIVPVSPGACFKFHIPVRNADTIPRAVD